MATSSIIDINKIVNEIKNAISRIRKGEENIRENIEFILRSEVYNKLSQTEKEGLQIHAIRLPNIRYEVTVISGGRIDALHGNVVIEYEEPGKLKTKRGIDESVTQVEKYIKGLASDETKFSRYFGVVLDGYKIGFVRYRQSSKQFEIEGPSDINNNTVAKLVEAIIGLRRRALGAEELLSDFGPESDVAKESIGTLYNKLQRTSPRTKALYEDWKRVFSQVCAYSPEKITGLGQAYGLGEVGDSEKLLFALHTYYALIMKLLAAEVASVYMTPMFKSYLRELEDAYYKGHEELKAHLSKLEEGGIFTVFGIVNFLEADYFGWYLDEWDEEVQRMIKEFRMEAVPANPKRLDSEWLTATKTSVLSKLMGTSDYNGYEGINSGGANAIFWLRPIVVIAQEKRTVEVTPHLLSVFRQVYGLTFTKNKAEVIIRQVLVENFTEGAKKEVGKVREIIEDFFIFPLIKSRHLKKWRIDGYIYTLMTQDPVRKCGYDERWVKTNFPKVHKYLKRFETLFSGRPLYKKYYSREDPFYSMFDVGPYTYASYKVVWNQMGSKLVTAVVSTVEDLYLGNRQILPEHVLAFIPTENEDEAHYICACLNSSISNFILQSLAKGTKSFGTPRFIKDYLNIKKFNPSNVLHRQLSDLSKRAHKLTTEAKKDELAKVEEEIDKVVAQLYGLTDEELMEVKKCLAIPEGKENEEESEGGIEPQPSFY